MKSREYNLAPEEKTAREQMMELILISSRFTSSITVENEEKHFNGKRESVFMWWQTAVTLRRRSKRLTGYFRMQ